MVRMGAERLRVVRLVGRRMSVRLVAQEPEAATCLYDSVTMVAFGPVFDTVEKAEDFLGWLGTDPRRLTTVRLAAFYSQWYDERCDPDTGDLLETVL